MSHLEQGDIIELDFNPSLGHEPAKRRPALVVSVYAFNMRSSLVCVVPITSKRRDYPLHVPIESNCADGWACVEQLRTVDVFARDYRVLGYAEEGTMKKVLGLVRGMFDLR